MYVFDSSPLIYLARVEKLEILEFIDAHKVVPEGVFWEVVVVGKEKGKENALELENIFKRGVIEVISIEDGKLLKKLKKIPGLARADAEVICLAKDKGAIAIIDDEFARRVASALKVQVHGTIYLILKLLKEGKISRGEAEAIINEMIKSGFRCSAELYSEILHKIRKLTEGF